MTQTAPPDRSPAMAEATKLRKRSLVIAGHRTSISLENIFWDQLKLIAADRGQSIASLVAAIDESRGTANLSSAIRVHVIETVLSQNTRQ